VIAAGAIAAGAPSIAARFVSDDRTAARRGVASAPGRGLPRTAARTTRRSRRPRRGAARPRGAHMWTRSPVARDAIGRIRPGGTSSCFGGGTGDRRPSTGADRELPQTSPG
jgi:hypothetical protein